jgi:hypothetical protein
MARAVKMTTMRAKKKMRWLRAMRAMTKTYPREEGDDGHNNQLGTKAAATARTVVATTARTITMAARATATGAKRAMAMMEPTAMATMATKAKMTPNCNKDNKNQAATTTRVTRMVARATVTEAKRATAMMGTTATRQQ